MDAQAQVIDFLKLNGLPFELRQHPAVHTMDDCAALGLPAPHCKNLFLCNRAATQFYLFLLGADKPFVTREISHALGVSRLSFGKDGERTILSGIAKYYKPEELVGKQVVAVVNLAPRKIAGIESQGMILSAVDDEDNLRLMSVGEGVEDGAIIG